MYTLLTGAIKNVGDFLIFERAKQLLRLHTGESDFLELGRWEALDGRLDEINRTRAIIICGGPGYAPDFYPGIYALARNLTDIRIPIIPLGLGWSGAPMYYPERFRFSSQSLAALRDIHSRFQVTSCRDITTRDILDRHGIRNVTMTGCPAWYDAGSIGRKFRAPAEVRRVVVSTSPEPWVFYWQNVALLREVSREYRRRCPEVELYAVFNRGIVNDENTSEREARHMRSLARCAEDLGYIIVDAAYDTSKIEFFRDCDLHLGYRVHAHIFFLSIRKPSFLLQVDGRGRALSQTLGLSDTPALERSPGTGLRSYARHVLSARTVRPVPRLEAPATLNWGAVRKIVGDARAEQAGGFRRFDGIDTMLDRTYADMVRFLGTLP